LNTATPARAVVVTGLPGDAPAQVDQQGIDSTIAEDANVTRALAAYRLRVAELDRPIARLDAAIEKRGIGGGGVGNFVADAMRAEASRRTKRNIPLAVVNTGGLRKNSIAAGRLSTTDIYELLPFDNTLVLVDLTGAQLQTLLTELVKSRDAQSGGTLTFRADAEDRNPQLTFATLNSAGKRKSQPIVQNRIYTIVTIDYLVNRGGNYSVLKEAKRTVPLNVTVRDAVIEHLRRENARGRQVKGKLDNRFRRSNITPQPTQTKTEGGAAR
jgi:2',3'-cyclic-nucleotide 2'-phosphodiesterase (5'-nucleotidase family)